MDEIIKLIRHSLKQASIAFTTVQTVNGVRFDIVMDNGHQYSLSLNQDTPLEDIDLPNFLEDINLPHFLKEQAS